MKKAMRSNAPSGLCPEETSPALRLLCSSVGFAKPAPTAGSGAVHSWPLTQSVFPRINPIPGSFASLLEQPQASHTPSRQNDVRHLTPSKDLQHLMETPCPWRGSRWVTQADYSTQQALQTGCTDRDSCWGDAEATGANPREQEECQQTR